MFEPSGDNNTLSIIISRYESDQSLRREKTHQRPQPLASPLRVRGLKATGSRARPKHVNNPQKVPGFRECGECCLLDGLSEVPSGCAPIGRRRRGTLGPVQALLPVFYSLICSNSSYLERAAGAAEAISDSPRHAADSSLFPMAGVNSYQCLLIKARPRLHLQINK